MRARHLLLFLLVGRLGVTATTSTRCPRLRLRHLGRASAEVGTTARWNLIARSHGLLKIPESPALSVWFTLISLASRVFRPRSSNSPRHINSSSLRKARQSLCADWKHWSLLLRVRDRLPRRIRRALFTFASSFPRRWHARRYNDICMLCQNEPAPNMTATRRTTHKYIYHRFSAHDTCQSIGTRGTYRPSYSISSCLRIPCNPGFSVICFALL